MGYWTQTQAVVTDIGGAYDVCIAPPIARTVVVEECNDESQSSITGRHIKQKGYVQGADIPLRQDTYLTGTVGRAGRDFTAAANTWYDNHKSPYYDTYMLFMPNSTLGQTFEVVSTGTTSGIEAAEIIVHRGYPGVGGALTDYTAANTNCYLHFAYGSSYDYRFAMEFGKPFRLDLTTDGTNWSPVMVASRYITERYLQENGDAVRLRVWTDPDTLEFWLEIGNGDQLHHWGGTGATGKIRLVGKNGFAGLEYYPLRHGKAGLNKGSQAYVPSDTPHPNADNARVVVNGLTPTPADQSVAWNVTTDGVNFGFSAEATMPDAGEGLGSAVASKLSDMTLLVDEVYADHWPDDPTFPQEYLLRSVLNEETMTFDDQNRCLMTSGRLTLNNYDGIYNGAFGNFALALNSALNNYGHSRGAYFRRVTGIAGAGEEGIGFYRKDPTRLVFLPYADKRILMMVPICQEVNYSGWARVSAVRHVARCCNISSRFLQNIPYYRDGPAGPDCPFDVLERGTGQNPKWRFGPEMSGWSILLLLANDAGVPITPAVSIPYFTGFDPSGGLRFEPFDPQASLPSVMFTSEIPAADNQFVFPIVGHLNVGNSTSQMRTETNVQGLDPLSYQLTHVHQSTALAVRRAVGYRYPILERNARYGANPVDISNTLTSVCSQPSQVVSFPSLHLPGFYPGNTFLCYDKQIGLQQFVCTSMTSKTGSDPYGKTGRRQALSIYTGRNVNAYPTANGILF